MRQAGCRAMVGRRTVGGETLGTGTLRQWDSGAARQWDSKAVGQQGSGTARQWDSWVVVRQWDTEAIKSMG